MNNYLRGLLIFTFCCFIYLFFTSSAVKQHTGASTHASTPQTQPRLCVTFVIDQFGYNYVRKLRPYFSGALKLLLDRGVVYQNAHYPHAVPETCPGHATLSTGAYPFAHGIIANVWFDKDGKQIECDDDALATAAVHNNINAKPRAKGPAQIMVDNLSDQFVLSSEHTTPKICYSLSIKSRAAIAMANKLGKAIWFDKDTGEFTSSKAYFNQLPTWLEEFNQKQKVSQIKSVNWQLTYNKDNPAYKFDNINNLTYARYKRWAGQTIPIPTEKDVDDRYIPVYQSPQGNTLLLDLAKECINKTLNDKNTLFLWVSLSSLDYVGHNFGSDSLEAIDTIYHLDQELMQFMEFVESKVGKNNVLFALTADHGSLPIQGILQQEGMKSSFKLMNQDFIKEMNDLINKEYGYENFIVNFQMPTFYFNQQLVQLIDESTLAQMIASLKTYLLSKKGIKNVWTYQELDTLPFNTMAQELETFFKFQRYPGRSGQLFVQLDPFCLLTRYAEGTSHETPYNYDTHVPLIIYRPGSIENKKITDRVFMTQFANTMAQILNIPQPSTSTAPLLPGINYNQSPLFKD